MRFEVLIRLICEDIHTVVMSTSDENGYPRTAAIDIMDGDESGFYFLTAVGKSLYKRLKSRPRISFTGIKGSDTMSRIAVTVSGECAELGNAEALRLIGKNPYMLKIYPNEQARRSLTAFKVCKGEAEYFDLSKLPPERGSFVFGGLQERNIGYIINLKCTRCGKCAAVCPTSCISGKAPGAFVIDRACCLGCGACMNICAYGAVENIGEKNG